MNYIHIIEPRFHDDKILIAKHKVGDFNQIKIDWHEYPDLYYITGEDLRKYPTQEVWSEKYKRNYTMYVMPVTDLKTDLILGDL